MNKDTYLDNKLPTIMWALLLIWWGIRWSVLTTLPEGSGLLVTGVILIGANLWRKFSGSAVKPFTVFLGSISLLSGGALIFISQLGISVQPPIFETLMIVLGVVILGYVVYGSKKQVSSN